MFINYENIFKHRIHNCYKIFHIVFSNNITYLCRYYKYINILEGGQNPTPTYHASPAGYSSRRYSTKQTTYSCPGPGFMY